MNINIFIDDLNKVAVFICFYPVTNTFSKQYYFSDRDVLLTYRHQQHFLYLMSSYIKIFYSILSIDFHELPS